METIKNYRLRSDLQKEFLVDIFHKKNNTAKPILIFCHGFKGFKDWGCFDLFGKKMAKNDFVFVKFNFSHNGTTLENPTEFDDLEAFGNNNFSIELADLQTVIDFILSDKFIVASEEVDKTKLYLAGHSRGGGIAIIKAAECLAIKKLVTLASVAEFGKFWKEEQMQAIKEKGVLFVRNERTKQNMPLYWQLYQNYFDNLARLHIPTIAKNIAIPFLIVHGTEDAAVPFSAAEELQHFVAGSKLLTVANANYVFGAQHPFLTDELPKDFNFVVDEMIKFLKGNDEN